jgi:hypothetical protein
MGNFSEQSENSQLDEIGGEPLAGSGFENEIPDPSFEMSDSNSTDGKRRRPPKRRSTAMSNNTTTPKRDYRQEVTDNIIKMLEQGTAPWQKPWEPGSLEMPLNPTSQRFKRLYRGGNAMHLMAISVMRGYDDPRWLTYRQAQQNGWQALNSHLLRKESLHASIRLRSCVSSPPVTFPMPKTLRT